MARYRPPDYLPREVLERPDFISACERRDLGDILAISIKWGGAGFSFSHVARRCKMGITPVHDYINHKREPLKIEIFERVADGLHIPGEMMGLSRREWEADEAALGGDQAGPNARGTDVEEELRAEATLLQVARFAKGWEQEKAAGELTNHVTGYTSISTVVRESATGAANLIMSAGRDSIDPLSIEQSYEEVRRLLVDYTLASGADRQVLQEATALRDNLQRMTGVYQKLPQSSDLYLMIGLLSGICSYVCLDLGYTDEAMTQARVAFMMGDLAGHDGLRAWALGTRALIARFQEHYPEALGYIRKGLQYATSGTALVRLRSGEGQTLAHMGDAENAIKFLRLAKDAREQVNSPDIASGIFAFTEAKQAYYAGSSLQWLPDKGNARAAELESLQAIRMFQQASPENRGLADELLAHVYLGNSRLTLGEIDGSLEALKPVLDLPLQARSAWHLKRMRQITQRLQREKFSGSRLAISAREEISAFIETPERADSLDE